MVGKFQHPDVTAGQAVWQNSIPGSPLSTFKGGGEGERKGEDRERAGDNGIHNLLYMLTTAIGDSKLHKNGRGQIDISMVSVMETVSCFWLLFVCV